MLSIGQKFPQFSLTGVVSHDLKTAFQPFTQDSFPGKWQVVFFWPKDFTFVCPTEIAAFGKLDREFKARDAQILGVSIDSEFVHLAWRRDKEELHNLPFPMLADINRALATTGAPGLTEKQIWAIALASAIASRNVPFTRDIESLAAAHLDAADINGARAAASIMGMNNIYYRFLHLVEDPEYAQMPARLRMNVIGNPGIDK